MQQYFQNISLEDTNIYLLNLDVHLSLRLHTGHVGSLPIFSSNQTSIDYEHVIIRYAWHSVERYTATNGPLI